MENELLKNNKQLLSKTVLLPEKSNSDIYAIYSRETFKHYTKDFLINDKPYKHRLYLYKKIKNVFGKTLTFIVLTPGITNHLKESSFINKCTRIAESNNYIAFEILSLFTLRSTDTIDALLEKAILDVTRMDLTKNDIILAYGDNIKATKKHNNISLENLNAINKVREYKIKDLLQFLRNKNTKIYTIGLTLKGNPKTLQAYKNQPLIEYKF